MKQLFRIFNLVIILITLSGFAFGVAPALTTVTATLTDSTSQVWFNARWRVEIIPPFNNPNRMNNNGNPVLDAQEGVTDGTGTFVVTVDNNSVVTPAGSQQRFTLCPNATVQSCTTVNTSVSGTSLNLSTLLSTALLKPFVNSGPTLTRAYSSAEVNGGLGAQYVNTTDFLIYQCIQLFCSNGTGWVTSGSASFVTVYPSALPSTFPTQGGLGFLYNPTGLQGLYEWNGTNWFDTSPYNGDARLRGCDNSGVSDDQACLDTLINSSIAAGSGQSINIPAGTYRINTPLHIRRNVIVNGSGSAQQGPVTIIQYGPGANIVFDKSTYSSDGGSSDFSIFRSIKFIATSIACTASNVSSTLTCSGNNVANLNLSAGDYCQTAGFNGALWQNAVSEDQCIVSSTTAGTIVLANAVTPLFNGSITVWKAGFVATTGTITNGSTVITAVGDVTKLEPGAPVLACGVPVHAFVFSRNAGASTITLNVPATSSACGPTNLTKGPLAGIEIHAGSIRLEDVMFDHIPGYSYNVYGSSAGSPSVVADGNYLSYARILDGGDKCVRLEGNDANEGTFIGIQGTACANGGYSDVSTLGNTEIGNQFASSGGGNSYEQTNVNAASTHIGPYMEGGQPIAQWGIQALVVGGTGMLTGSNGTNNGNIINPNGHMSPTFFIQNDQGSASTGFCNNNSKIVTNVTGIANWHVGDTYVSGCSGGSNTVTATDGISQLTLANNMLAPSLFGLPMSQISPKGYFGDPAGGNGVFGFGYTKNNSTEFDWVLNFDNPYVFAVGQEPGYFSWRYRATNSAIGMAFPTDESTNNGDQTGGATAMPVKFPQGIRVGAAVNSMDIKANASTAAPTTGQWPSGSVAISTTQGQWQQITASKSITGTIDLTQDSTTLANPNAAYTGGCAPGDSITGTNIKQNTTLISQLVLSKPANATVATTTVVCHRLPKAHATTVGDLNGTSTILNFTVSGWAVNDTVSNSLLPTGTFILTIVGTTVTVSNNATGTATGVPMTDAAFIKVANLSSVGSPTNNHVVTFDTTVATNPTLKDSGVQIIKFSTTLSPASVAANTCAEQILTATGVLAGDAVFLNKATSQAGLGISGVRAAGSNQIGINFCNNTASPIVPTASEVYTGGLFR